MESSFHQIGNAPEDTAAASSAGTAAIIPAGADAMASAPADLLSFSCAVYRALAQLDPLFRDFDFSAADSVAQGIILPDGTIFSDLAEYRSAKADFQLLAAIKVELSQNHFIAARRLAQDYSPGCGGYAFFKIYDDLYQTQAAHALDLARDYLKNCNWESARQILTELLPSQRKFSLALVKQLDDDFFHENPDADLEKLKESDDNLRKFLTVNWLFSEKRLSEADDLADSLPDFSESEFYQDLFRRAVSAERIKEYLIEDALIDKNPKLARKIFAAARHLDEHDYFIIVRSVAETFAAASEEQPADAQDFSSAPEYDYDAETEEYYNDDSYDNPEEGDDEYF